MPSRFERDVEALEALIVATERRFHLWEGAIRSEDSTRPLVQYRQLFCLLAADAGYEFERIGATIYKDPTTARYARNAADTHITHGHRWWAEQRAALNKDWDAELARTD